MPNKSNIRWIDSNLGAPGPVHENSPVGLAGGGGDGDLACRLPGCRVNRMCINSAIFFSPPRTALILQPINNKKNTYKTRKSYSASVIVG